MQALNSVGYTRRTLAAAGIGMFIAFLFLAPLAVFAASSTVTITTDKTFYPSGTNTINVSGTVTPAPGVSGTFVAVSISAPNGGGSVDANEFAVNSATGAYSGSFVTGGPTYAAQGIYTITANYNGGTASATFQYGNTTSSTSQTGGGTTTTIVQQFTTTVNNVVTSVTTVVQNAVTTVSAVTATTVTQQVQTTTTVSATGGGSDSTALAIGAVGVIIAIIAAVLAVLAMRKK
jgi:hypothetical protein